MGTSLGVETGAAIGADSVGGGVGGKLLMVGFGVVGVVGDGEVGALVCRCTLIVVLCCYSIRLRQWRRLPQSLQARVYLRHK